MIAMKHIHYTILQNVCLVIEYNGQGIFMNSLVPVQTNRLNCWVGGLQGFPSYVDE